MTLVSRHAPAAPGAPTLLALHGRGGHETDLLGLGEALGGGIGVLAPRGPELQPPGYAWFRNMGIGNPVAESLDLRLTELMEWLEATAAELGLDTPMTVVGFSNGGMMAGALAAARPDLVDRVALLSSAYPLPPEVYALGGLRGRRVLAIGGDSDPVLPLERVEAGVAAYRAAGAEVTTIVRPGGHGVGADEIDALRTFLGVAV
jgi:phospholipase/carboxylesterase